MHSTTAVAAAAITASTLATNAVAAASLAFAAIPIPITVAAGQYDTALSAVAATAAHRQVHQPPRQRHEWEVQEVHEIQKVPEHQKVRGL